LIELHKAEQRLKEIEKKFGKDDLFGYIDGYDFSLIMQDLLIPDGDYVIDTGNWENVNYVCAYGLIKRIKKHPLIWKLFFMI
jgi:hypothetical protein